MRLSEINDRLEAAIVNDNKAEVEACLAEYRKATLEIKKAYKTMCDKRVTLVPVTAKPNARFN